MAISVKYGSDTYSFHSSEGKHYWYLSDTPRSTYTKMLGMIPHYDLGSKLYEMALSQGYTDSDFEQHRTYKAETRRVSSKPAKRVATRILSDRKPVQKKSTLTNSIKLF
jgi:hypothetical protein